MDGGTFALAALSRIANAARERRIQFFGAKLTVSGPPTDGQPGGECFETRPLATRSEDVNLRAPEERTGDSLDHSATRTSYLTNWGPTLEMSGGLKRAQHALERPLDRRVGPQCGNAGNCEHGPMLSRTQLLQAFEPLGRRAELPD